MAVKLSEQTEQASQAFTLSEVERVSYKVDGTPRTLAVATSPDGRAHLCKVGTKPIKNTDGKRPKEDSNGKTRATEQVLTRTATLADIGAAVREGLIEL